MAKKLTEAQEKAAETSLSEEEAAIRDYTRRKKGTSGPLRAAFEHALPEERDHAKLFRKALAADEAAEDND